MASVSERKRNRERQRRRREAQSTRITAMLAKQAALLLTIDQARSATSTHLRCHGSTVAARVSAANESCPSNQCKSAAQRPFRQILLISRRGVLQNGSLVCDECKKLRNPVWANANSNFGKVVLCRRCKARVMDRSFGKLDLLDRAILTAFETNRQRH